ncbi:MAG: TMEM165/GDT1 family protein [Candidatus Nomurabacteria bacterium]|nr:TMEM165/GDT1 family protein [Candidatus Nomurabacteria bacterium]USN88147.1 MAG: TMEM165/GDT1 family protein [Candidatus Nomurabacteria bacterium]
MELVSIFVSTFAVVFVGELGDKTQIATGTGALAKPGHTKIIFLSSSIALIAVAGLTTFFAGLIPKEYMPYVVVVGGIVLIIYGIYLYLKAGKNEDGLKEDFSEKRTWVIFFTNFWIIFIAEMGDKTQMVTLGSALENQSHLWLVFITASSALVLVTALTIFGVTKLPKHWICKVQKLGAVFMILFGIHMLY